MRDGNDRRALIDALRALYNWRLITCSAPAKFSSTIATTYPGKSTLWTSTLSRIDPLW